MGTSTPGANSIPGERAESTEATEATEATETTGRLPTVCLVDDNADIRQVMRMLLEDEGYHVIEATNGVEGLAIVRAHPKPLIVLLDHKLPAMDGCDLLDLVAQNAELRERHAFILVTASPQRAEQDCGDTIEDLQASILGKPFDIYRVLEMVDDAAHRLMESKRGGD